MAGLLTLDPSANSVRPPRQERLNDEQKTDALFRIPVYTVLLAACALSLATFHGDPSLLYRATREDGVVEWITVASMLVLALLVARRLLPPPAALPRLYRAAGWTLVGLALAAVGEEISWGQRLLGFETGETMKAVNLQHETNLHNLIPGPLFNGLIVFTLGIGFVLIPTIWRKSSSTPPLWLPSSEVSLLMLNAILINHYRFGSLPEKVGIVVMLTLLAQQTVSAMASRNIPMLAASVAGWVTAACLYHSRTILREANHQYEIRELLIVILTAVWAEQTLRAYDRPQHPLEGAGLPH